MIYYNKHKMCLNKKRTDIKMKKVLAVLLAVICAFSVSVFAFATADFTKCDICGLGFDSSAEYNEHLERVHARHCTNGYDKNYDGTVSDDEKCTFVTYTLAAYEQHQKECEFKDKTSNWDKAFGYIKAGDIKTGLKYALDGIIEFFKSDTFKDIINKVVDVVKGIDLGGIFSKVKDIAGKIPVDDIVNKVKDVVSK